MESLTKVILALLIVTKFIGGGIFHSKGKVNTYDSFINPNNGTQSIKIAILPFENVSNDPNAGKKIVGNLLIYLAGGGIYEIVEQGKVEKALLDLKVRSVSEVNEEIIQKLGTDLKCETLLLGTITEYGDTRVGTENFPTIALNLRLIETKTAKILWTFSNTEIDKGSNSPFSTKKPLSLSELSQIVAKKISDNLTRQKQKIYTVFAPPEEEIKKAEEKAGETKTSEKPLQKIESATATTTAEIPKTEEVKTETTKIVEAPKTETSAEIPIVSNVESKELSEENFKNILGDIAGYNKEALRFKKHYHNQIETVYAKDSLAISASLVDYINAERAKKFIEYYFPENDKNVSVKTEENTSLRIKTSNFGYANMGNISGQIGIFLRGPKKAENEILGIAKELNQKIKSTLTK